MKTEEETIFEAWNKTRLPEIDDGSGGDHMPPKTSVGTGGGGKCPRCQGMELILVDGVLIKCPNCNKKEGLDGTRS